MNGIFVNGRFILASTIEGQHALIYQQEEKIKRLQRENDELKLELITRVGELQTMSDEKAALKAHVNDLRDAISMLNLKKIEGFLRYGRCYSEILQTALDKTSAQSLHDHCARCTSGERSERDMRLAEKVREACINEGAATCVGSTYDVVNDAIDDAIEAIRNMDLTPIIDGMNNPQEGSEVVNGKSSV